MRPIAVLRHSLVGAALACLLAACGGGGGDPGAAAAPGGGAGGTPAAPVTRSVPGYTVGASRLSALQAGQPCTVQVSLTADPGQAAVQSLAGWLGSDTYAQPGTTIAATPVAGLADTWRIVVAVPDPLPPSATVWLRITTADGSVMEVGRNAFELAGIPAH
jgi:hypothetical protein